jgi:hypothetical protein
MQGMIDTASEQILEFWGLVRKGREHCVTLLSELELLRGLIDPDCREEHGLVHVL